MGAIQAEILPGEGKGLVGVFPRLVACLDDGPKVYPSLPKFKHQFFITAGSPIIPMPPQQNTGDEKELYAAAEACSDDFRSYYKEIARRIGAKSPVEVPDKLHGRALAKARDDYHGDLSRVCDLKRVSVYLSSPEQARKMANFLRPCNNSAVVRFEDSISEPDEDGGLCRILANVRMPNGHIVEIQGRYSSMEAAYKRTELLWVKIRALRARIAQMEENHQTGVHDYLNLQRQHNSLTTKRLRIHEDAAKNLTASVARTLWMVRGFPVAEIHDLGTRESIALVPDVKTGTYIVDNNFLPLLKIPEAEKGIMPGIFIARAIALSTNKRAHDLAAIPGVA